MVELLAREVLLRLADKSATPPTLAATINDLTEALLGSDPQQAARIIEDLYQDGVDARELHLTYLASAARLMGTWWTADKVTFTNVSTGVGRIYAIMRSLAARMPRARMPDGRHALFAPIPEDDHTLGLRMAAEMARKDGWEIDLQLALGHNALLDHYLASDHAIIGLSGGSERGVSHLARLVIALRMSAPGALILVSGNIANVARESLELMHIDVIASDIDGALSGLAGLWNQLEARAT